MAETILWLIRHPEPEAAAAGRCYGSLDVSLSETGVRQADLLAKTLANASLAAIYSSPRQRCLRTAGVLAAGRDIRAEPCDFLRELDFGSFEGRTYEEIEARYPELYREWMEHPTEVQFPGGESFAQMRLRVIGGIAELRRRHRGRSFAVVTHGGVIRILLSEALAIPPVNLFRVAQRYAAVNQIRYLEDFPSVELVNAEPGAIGSV